MLTVKDYLLYKESTTSELQNKVDEWLMTEVFPNHKDNAGYECPEWIKLGILKTMLEQRGWSVTTHSGYQGNFVYLSVPPQGG